MTIDLAELKAAAERAKASGDGRDSVYVVAPALLALIEAVEAAKELQHTKKQMEILGEADSTLQDALAPFTEDRA